MLTSWYKDVRKQSHEPHGWIVIGKILYYSIAMAGGLYTIHSINSAETARVRAEMLERENTIQKSLTSDNRWERIAGLRALKTFPVAFERVGMSLEKWDLDPGSFSKEAIIGYFSRFEEAEFGKEAPAPLSVGSRGESRELRLIKPKVRPGADERLVAMNVLAYLGKSSWSTRNGGGLLEWLWPSKYENSDEGLDFSWIPLRNNVIIPPSQDPTNVFTEKYFEGILIEHARFDCVQMRRIALNGATISFAELNGANLYRAEFMGSQVKSSKLKGVDALGANFSDANLENVSFEELREDEENDSEDIVLTACKKLRGARHADLAGAKFDNATVTGGFFQTSRIPGASFAGSFISDSRFDSARAEGVTFKGATIELSKFNSADMRSANFDRASFVNVDFSEANISYASFIGSRFHDESSAKSLLRAKTVEGANFFGATMPSGVSICELLKKGAVLIEEQTAWETSGKPILNWRKFSGKGKAQLVQCR